MVFSLEIKHRVDRANTTHKLVIVWNVTFKSLLEQVVIRTGRHIKFHNKCSENSRTQIVFRTDIFQKLALGAPDWSHWSAIVTLKITYWKYWLHANIKGATSCKNFSSVTKTDSFLSGTKTSVARGRSGRLKMDSLVIFKGKMGIVGIFNESLCPSS